MQSVITQGLGGEKIITQGFGAAVPKETRDFVLYVKPELELDLHAADEIDFALYE